MSSEIEVQFFITDDLKKGFLSIVNFFNDHEFSINLDIPGYFHDQNFQFTYWEKIYEFGDVFEKSDCGVFCVNLVNEIKKQKINVSLILNLELKNISIKANDNFFIDVNKKIVIEDEFYWFIHVCESALLQLKVSRWLIGQADIDPERTENFLSYPKDGKFAEVILMDIVNWYNNEYLTRWG